MKTATLDIYEPFQADGYCVDIYYRGKRLQDFCGLELAPMLEKAIIYLENQKFTRLSVAGKTYNFKNFMKGTA
jgi:hypothetical protein